MQEFVEIHPLFQKLQKKLESGKKLYKKKWRSSPAASPAHVAANVASPGPLGRHGDVTGGRIPPRLHPPRRRRTTACWDASVRAAGAAGRGMPQVAAPPRFGRRSGGDRVRSRRKAAGASALIPAQRRRPGGRFAARREMRWRRSSAWASIWTASIGASRTRGGGDLRPRAEERGEGSICGFFYVKNLKVFMNCAQVPVCREIWTAGSIYYFWKVVFAKS